MGELGEKGNSSSALALGSVQFFFTLGWTVYVIYLPELLRGAGVAPSWLPWLLMADQLVFALMDIAFGMLADRMTDYYRQLARLLLLLTTLSAGAFLLLPMMGGASAGWLLAVLAVWVISASVVRAPTLVLLAKRAKVAQQGRLVAGYAAGIALASALSPFLGLWLKGTDPRLPFALSALVLLAAVACLLRVSAAPVGQAEGRLEQPISFKAYLPLLLILGLTVLGFQVHAFVNAAPQYLAYATKENLPWLMPLLWLGFFAALLGVGGLTRRCGALPVAVSGILLTALSSYASLAVNGLAGLVFMQMLAGAGWAMAFAGLMEQASVAGSRGAEGLFMGSFFAVTALASLARIGFATQLLPAWQSLQFQLPATLLLAAGVIAAVYAIKRPKSLSAPGPG